MIRPQEDSMLRELTKTIETRVPFGAALVPRLREWRHRLRRGTRFNRVMQERTAAIVEEFGIQDWFLSIAALRDYHCAAVRFLTRRYAARERGELLVLETGCGIGQTFAILAKHGFSHFIGVEVDEATCHAARKFLRFYEIDAQIFHGDGRETIRWVEEESVDIYLPLNWTYFIPDMDRVFETGARVLKPDGLMVVDVVRDDFAPETAKDAAAYEGYPFKHPLDEVRTMVQSAGLAEAGREEFKWRWNFYLTRTA